MPAFASAELIAQALIGLPQTGLHINRQVEFTVKELRIPAGTAITALGLAARADESDITRAAIACNGLSGPDQTAGRDRP
jgi:hypothetical protein